MIPAAHITNRAQQAPWATPDQVEQDLVLSRLIVVIASHPLLGDELVFRGGTCLHKLHLPVALRYSEDLDYVRVTSGPIGGILDALRSIGDGLSFTVSTDVRSFPKVLYRTTFTTSDNPMRIKIEINTHERNNARELVRLPFKVASPWWSGEAAVLTFAPEELIATKLRAIYQRRKGRDLFDMWLALVQMGLDPTEIVECFAPYRPEGYTRALALENFDKKVAHAGFRTDLNALVTEFPDGYTLDEAAALVRAHLLEQV